MSQNDEQPTDEQPTDNQPTSEQSNTGGNTGGQIGSRIDIDYQVQLVPQPTDKSCWGAAMAMIVGYRDNASYTPDAIAAQAGMDTNTRMIGMQS